MADYSEGIISIRPNFAEAILSGTKSVELRRRIPPVGTGTRLWIYATLPLGAVVGSAIVDKIIRETPEHLWLQWGEKTAIGRDVFDAYFQGSDVAVGLVLTAVRRGKPVSIQDMRNIRTGFHPPQVISRLSHAEANSISSLAGI